MWHGFKRTVEVALYVFAVEGIIYSALVCLLYAVVIVPKRYVQASLADVLRVERMADNMVVCDGLPDLCVAIYAQESTLQI